MNKVILMGRLTADPEVRYSQSAEPLAIVRFTIAVNKRFKREGEPDADFINCVAFGKVGEFTSKYFKKGMMIAVVGRLQVRNWEDNNGQKRVSTEVIIEEQFFAESKAAFELRKAHAQDAAAAPAPSSNSASAPASTPEQGQPDGFYNVEDSVDDDDLPF